MNSFDHLKCDEILTPAATHDLQNTPCERSDEVSVQTSSTKKNFTKECMDNAVDSALSQVFSNWLGADAVGKRSSCSGDSNDDFPVRKQPKTFFEHASMMDEVKTVSLAKGEQVEEYKEYLRQQATIFENENIAETPADSGVTDEEFEFLFNMHWKRNYEDSIDFYDTAQKALFLLKRAKRAIFSQSKPEIKFHTKVSNNVDVMKMHLKNANKTDRQNKYAFLKYYKIPKDENDADKEVDKVFYVDEYFKSNKTCKLLEEICKNMWIAVRCFCIACCYDDISFDKKAYNKFIADGEIANIGTFMCGYLDRYVLQSVGYQIFKGETTSTFLFNLFEKFDIQANDCVHSTARKNLRITFILIKKCYKSLPSNVALFCFLSSLKTHDVSYNLQQMAHFVVIPEDMENLVVAQDASGNVQKSITFIKEELEKFSLLLLTNTENVPTSPGYDPS